MNRGHERWAHRGHVPARLRRFVERMRRRGVRSLVSKPDGRLVGVLYRDDAEELLGVDGFEIERE